MRTSIRKSGWLVLLVMVGMLDSCFVPQIYDSTDHHLISLSADDLAKQGIAFLTPSTITGQEEEKQALALIFADVLKKERPAIRCVGLPETLNALNRAGLADDYKHMTDEYRNTGIFGHGILQKVGEATKTGYVAQLKLMNFVQGSSERFGFLGLRMIETKYSHLRLFFQIWDVRSGSIAWEGVHEMHYAVDTISEDTVTLKTTIHKAAQDIIKYLP
ncbi:MAG: hypothetical protein A4E73_01357 [Syntrophaceae bacterium PtaU1.Bin231]|mgnify:FL=1|nr:MAG: hypothetical protein A4E73_01357 [Syntrophaceae bacterium PtaU1.Bin231]HOG16082.1 hypothetical protein [Syntrophales bacterium]